MLCQKSWIKHSTDKMVNQNRNWVLEKIREEKTITDKELSKSISKDMDNVLSNDQLEKILLELEIKGLINVSWFTKDTRRIEIVTEQNEHDEYEEQNKEAEEKDYESSFPGAENGT